jgi:hypothetical protein
MVVIRLYSLCGNVQRGLREDFGDATGKPPFAADMAKLCGLAPGNGAAPYRKSPVRPARRPKSLASWRWQAIVTRSSKLSMSSIGSISTRNKGLRGEKNSVNKNARRNSPTPPEGFLKARESSCDVATSHQFLPTSFANVSRKPMVRLNTGRSGVESLSRVK